MKKLTDEQKAAYFHRSFAAVDGLWFMKMEDKYGFEKALEIDLDVWQIFPKIQAREIKKMLQAGAGIDNLKDCFLAAKEADGINIKTRNEKPGESFEICIEKCPWHNIMQKSGREHLSAIVGNTICQAEFTVWASEFGDDIQVIFGHQPRICAGGQDCVVKFSKKN